MVRVILIFIALSLATKLNAQLLHEQEIRSSYGNEYFSQLQSHSPGILNLLDKYIDHGFHVKDIDPGKYQELEAISAIPLRAKGAGEVSIEQFLQELEGPNFNPLNYNFFPTNDVQIFKLSGSNKIIYILSQEAILAN
jgi:hypothetical protein